MGESVQRVIVTATVAILALMVMGAAVAGWLLGRDIPTWLAVLVGSIGTGAFVTSGFFVLARNSETTMAALSESRANHHALAMAVAAKMTTAAATDMATPPTDGAKAA